MDTIPFLHANRIFTITFQDDLAFFEVRSILDRLLADDAFDPANQEHAEFYSIEVEEAAFKVWVDEMHVIIHRTAGNLR
ncbi:MAG: hypothetical protein AB1646_12335 [Thermodesulfobacteriota bacterium]